MWSVWQTCRTGRRAAGFLGGLLVALLLAAGPAAGQTFPSSNQMTLSNGGEATHPVMAAGVTSSGTEVQVYVAWIEGNEVYLKVGRSPLASPNSCTTGPGALVFGQARPLFAVNPSGPAIATNDRGVVVAWVSTPFGAGQQQQIQLWSSLGGIESLQALTFNGVTPNNPAVAADNSGVLVAAEGSVPGGTGVWLARPDGASFAYVRVSPTVVVAARRPSIASDGTKVHVVWRNGGVQHKRFDRGSTQAELDNPLLSPTTSLTSASVQFPPKVAVHGSEVTVAWFEGANPLAPTDLKAVTTTGGIFPAPGSALTVHSSTLRHSNLSLSVGPAGRLFGWQMADTIALTSSNHYLLKAATDRPFESGSYYESAPGVPTAGPSVVQDAAGRVVASWRENGTTTTQIRLGYDGGSGSGAVTDALVVWSHPKYVNPQTMAPGKARRPNFTVFIEPAEGQTWSLSDIGSVELNPNSPALGPSAIGDANGNGRPDMMVKFDRSDLGATVEGKIKYTVTVKLPNSRCPLSGDGEVDVMK